MKSITKDELIRDKLTVLSPCPECLSYIEDKRVHNEDYRNMTPEESRVLHERVLALEKIDIYKWSLEDKAEFQPGSYTLPSEEDMQPEEATQIAIDCIQTTYGLSPSAVSALIPFLGFYPSLSTDGEDQNCYIVQFGNDESKSGIPPIYSVEIVSETKEVSLICEGYPPN
jgi:hypothetical protein